MNRFKSIKKLLHFVYPDTYEEFDFQRVRNEYWADVHNIKADFEQKLIENGIDFAEIPKHITCERLIKWRLSNAFKRHGDSPFQLMEALYPGRFKAEQFRKVLQRYWNDK
ncbi:hypothetical protein QR721_03755 [Aciduricibacillus chroicocephali]|uniref:Uncharacterized protein n=1 Tax=Aciduricibacillus chroicocephali TaxID=3054939 RepID=A0ABY9L0K8_9BACI|nr:hypothetical protein QR721_03755 [Bacillaceae bacterium 44XB]